MYVTCLFSYTFVINDCILFFKIENLTEDKIEGKDLVLTLYLMEKTYNIAMIVALFKNI